MRIMPMVGAVVCLLGAFSLFLNWRLPLVQAAPAEMPAYTQGGEMLPVADYRQWIYLSSGLNMSYSAKPADMAMFDNVFVNPAAYRSFASTGIWPDKTVMVLESRPAESKGSINQHGNFQGASVMGLEVHVKDTAKFPGGWAFFDFKSPNSNGKLIPQDASCYSCHRDHGAVDTTFVQFYPTLLTIAREKRTLSDVFLKEEAEPSAGR